MRVHNVKKARKAQGSCRCGEKIKAGDSYRWWKFRRGPRYVRCMKATCAPKRSDLTRSDFYGQLYDLQDRRDDACAALRACTMDHDSFVGEIEDIANSMRDLGSEQQEKHDNMPEGLQQGDSGQLLEERAQECESRADDLEQAKDQGDFEDDEKPTEDELSALADEVEGVDLDIS